MDEQEWLGSVDPHPMLLFLREENNSRKMCLFDCACCRRVLHLASQDFQFECLDRVELAEQVLMGFRAREEHVVEEAIDSATPENEDDLDDNRNSWVGQAVAEALQRSADCWEIRNGTRPTIVWLPPDVPDLDELPGLEDAFEAISPVAGLTVTAVEQVASIPPEREPPPPDDPLDEAYHARLEQEQTLMALEEQRMQCVILRDIFGPLPFRRPTISPDVLAWDNRLIPRLVEAIYDHGQCEDGTLLLPYEDKEFGGLLCLDEGTRPEGIAKLGDMLVDAGCTDDAILQHLKGEDPSGLLLPHFKGCWVLDLILGRP